MASEAPPMAMSDADLPSKHFVPTHAADDAVAFEQKLEQPLSNQLPVQPQQ